MRPEVHRLATVIRPGVAAAHRWRGERGLTLIGWHRLASAGDRDLSTGVAAFEQHLDVLEDWRARVLPLEEAVTRLAAGTLPPRAVALTFDDGYASVVETAWPLLRARGLPASLFVCSGFLDGHRTYPWDRDGAAGHDVTRLSTADELRAAHREGLHIGSHTVSHAWLPCLDDGPLRAELTESRRVLAELLGTAVDTVAYPTGGWDRRVRAAAQRAGYRVGVTVSRGRNSPRTSPLSLRRAFVPDDPEHLSLMLDGAYTFLRPLDAYRGRKEPAL